MHLDRRVARIFENGSCKVYYKSFMPYNLFFTESDDFDENIYKNSFEKEVAESFRELGHDVLCGTEIAGLSVDLLIDNKFVVECDGIEDRLPCKVSNMKKQTIIERSGLKVSRISKREWSYSPKACIDRVINCNL